MQRKSERANRKFEFISSEIQAEFLGSGRGCLFAERDRSMEFRAFFL